MVDFAFREHYGIEDLIEIVRLLREPGGCPWDREQDHRSIRKNLLEEAYEVAQAIDDSDNEELREELGDLLLQIVLHSRMEEEEGTFDFEDTVIGRDYRALVGVYAERNGGGDLRSVYTNEVTAKR